MGSKRSYVIWFIICTVICVSTALVCVFNWKLLKRPVFQKTIELESPRLAKYQADGNIYIIDAGLYRLICMAPDGKTKWTVTTERLEQYVKFIDLAADERGNVYVCCKEFEGDAYLTKRDFIRQYDSRGKFVRDILVVDYTDDSEDRPHVFPQFSSFNYDNGVLSFIRTMESKVILYRFDTFRNALDQKVFYPGMGGYAVARVAMKDFNNFAYTTRSGDIYEVVDGAPSALRVSFNWTEKDGGIMPWFLHYEGDSLIFWDMASGQLFRINSNNQPVPVLPADFFESLSSKGQAPGYAVFGSYGDYYAGVFGDYAWFYNAKEFVTWPKGLELPPRERIFIATVQVLFAAAAISFFVSCFILVVFMFDRYVSLFVKQTVIIIPIVIIGFFVLYRTTFDAMSERIKTQIFHELSMVANLAAKQISGDDLEELTSTKDYQSDAYKKLSTAMKDIVADNKEVWGRSFYAGIMKGVRAWRWICVSDDEFNLFRPTAVVNLSDEELDFYNAGGIDSGIAETNEGLWAYASNALFKSDGEIAGFFEIGIDLNGYEKSNIEQSRKTVIIAALVCVVILLVLIVILAMIIRQLSTVASVLKRIGSGDYSARVHYKARDELGTVSYGFNSMAAELEKQIGHITEINASTVRFVPVQFMEYLKVPDITQLKLGASVQHNFTILFFDIRSFSIHSELMSVSETFKFINNILGVSGPVIRKYNGFVDKYMGDAAMALFPFAVDAVKAGIEIYQEVVLSANAKVKMGLDGVNIGVGLHTGPVYLGIIGENERLSGSVISNNVNLASRIESLTKQVKSGMLITSATFNRIPDEERNFSYRFIGMIKVAGVNEITGVFDILDALPKKVRQRRLKTKLVFESGVRLYHTKNYKKAEARFIKTLEADPDDLCASICLEETRARIKNPDLPSVFVFDRK
ncbi:MAG: HAMP domain-containing protein [Treponema sp.]|nr:HAMP domain-containing protein [Treponema sp.]